MAIAPISRTVGTDSIVDEMIVKFTHDRVIDYLLPGIPPTGRQVEIAAVVVVQFRDGKLASEHIYWDQASVLVQIGKLDPAGLPIAGVEVARPDPEIDSTVRMLHQGVQCLCARVEVDLQTDQPLHIGAGFDPARQNAVVEALNFHASGECDAGSGQVVGR